MIIFKHRYIATLFLVAGLFLASPRIDKQAGNSSAKNLHNLPKSSIDKSVIDANAKNKAGLMKFSNLARNLQDEKAELESSPEDEIEKKFESDLEKSEDDLNADLEGKDSKDNKDIPSIIKDSEENDLKVNEILSNVDAEISAKLVHYTDNKPHVIDVKIKDFKIVEEPADANLENGKLDVVIVVEASDKKHYSSKFTVKDGQLKQIKENETQEQEVASEEIDNDDNNETEEITFIYRQNGELNAVDIELKDGKISGEPAGIELEDEVIEGDAIFHTPSGDEIKSVTLNDGVLKVNDQDIDNAGATNIPDLTTSKLISAVILLDTDTGKQVFEADIQNGVIMNDESVPKDILSGEHDYIIITNQEGVSQIQHVHANDGAITMVEDTSESNIEGHLPLALVAGTGVLAADAIVNTQNGPEVRPVVFNNGVLTQEPAGSHLAEGSKDIDVVVHNSEGPHIEHVHLEDGKVTQAIADETSTSGTAQEGEQHVDVLLHDDEGYHVEDILVKDDQIMEEPSNLDLEHGEHIVDTLVHDKTGPHIEHWKVNEGMIITHETEAVIASTGHSKVNEFNGSGTKYNNLEFENGTVHVEMLLNYGKKSEIEDVLVNNGTIVKQSPGVDLLHGIHVAEAITENEKGPEIRPVVIHDGIVENADEEENKSQTENEAEPEGSMDVSQGEVDAQVIEGEGYDAKVNQVKLHDGKVVESSGPIDLEHGTHIIMIVFTYNNKQRIQKGVIADGVFRPIGREKQHALIVVKEDDKTEVSEVEIKDQKIVKQSEGTDLTTGVFTGTQIDINKDGSISGTKEIVGNDGRISEITTHINEPSDAKVADEGDALLVVDSETGTQVQQIHYKGSQIITQSGPLDLSQHQIAIMIVLNPETHEVQQAKQIVVENDQIKDFNAADEENIPFETSEEDNANYDQTPEAQNEYNEKDIEQIIQDKTETPHVGRRAFIKPSIYSRAFNPMKKRGLFNSYHYNHNFNINDHIKKVEIGRSLNNHHIKRISYQPRMNRAVQYQPRHRPINHRIMHAYHPGNYRALNNVGYSRHQVHAQKPYTNSYHANHFGNRFAETYKRKPIMRYNAQRPYSPSRNRFNNGQGIHLPSFTVKRHFTRPHHLLRI